MKFPFSKIFKHTIATRREVVYEDFEASKSGEKGILVSFNVETYTLLMITTGHYQFRTPLRVENWTRINTVGTRFN